MNNPTNSHSFIPQQTSTSTLLQSTISIASNNIISFTNYTKRLQIINEALSNNIDILELAETNLSTKQSKFIHKELLPNYYSFFSSTSNKCKGTGVTLLLKCDIHTHMIKFKENMGRYIYIDLAFK